MKLSRKKIQKGGLLEDVTDEEFLIYNQIFNDLIKYDKNVNLTEIQKTENRLLAIYLSKLSDNNVNTIPNYINSLHQKFLNLVVPNKEETINNPKKSSPQDPPFINVMTYKVNTFNEYYTRVNTIKNNK